MGIIEPALLKNSSFKFSETDLKVLQNTEVCQARPKTKNLQHLHTVAQICWLKNHLSTSTDH